MVCPRCITAVEKILQELSISNNKVELGTILLSKLPTKEEIEKLSAKLIEDGFELLSSNKAQIISKIKISIIEQIHHNKEPLEINFSDYLSESLGYDYQYLSRLFSEVEGITISRFIVVQKIEKVKELLFYDQITTEEIAFQLNYNSVAYLSSTFKKETGMTISQFKALRNPKRKSITDL